jgi:hypothetical protein
MPHRRLASLIRAPVVLRGPLAFALFAMPLGAQEATAPDAAQLRAELAALRAEYAGRLAALEGKLAALEAAQNASAQQPPPSTPPPSAPPPEPPPQAPAGPAQASNYFNPAMSVIGNFLIFGGHNRVESSPTANLEESEIGLQAIIDPYAKADFFLSFGDSGAEVEEGFVTFTSLPWDLLAKVGRMRVSFGKVNGLHPHVWPWADKPLPLINLVGGDEGWIGNGVSLARLIPLGDTFSELALQVFDGNAEGLFEAEERSDLAYNARYRIFRDLSEASNIDLGLSYGRGPNGALADSELQGVDVMVRWKPLRTATYRSATIRGEFIRSRTEVEGLGRQTASGWYLGADYQLAKRWWIGGRYESSERALDADLHDEGEALTLTFWPSEFSQLRGELRRRRYAEDITAEELLLQLQFAIGAHGAHPF